MTWKQVVGQELYVYAGSRLIYKRWLNTGVSRMFYEGEGCRCFFHF